MTARLRGLGIVLALIGFAFVIAGGFAFFKVQEGSASLKAFSAAQGVELSYNEDGQLIDRGETAGADAIMALLTDDWGYPVAASELDPADPVVNTASEYMYQMATARRAFGPAACMRRLRYITQGSSPRWPIITTRASWTR